MLSIRRTRPPLESLIDGLPDDYRSVEFDDGHLVVGPTGAFVVASAGADADEAARRVGGIAHQLRELLCARLSWAPFVDPLVVVDGPAGYSPAAALVPRRLLHDVLTAGHHQLRSEQVERIVAALHEVPRVAFA